MVEVQLCYAPIPLKLKFQQGQQECPLKLLKILWKYVLVGRDQEKEYEQKVIAWMEISSPTHSVQLPYLAPSLAVCLGLVALQLYLLKEL